MILRLLEDMGIYGKEAVDRLRREMISDVAADGGGEYRIYCVTIWMKPDVQNVERTKSEA